MGIPPLPPLPPAPPGGGPQQPRTLYPPPGTQIRPPAVGAQVVDGVNQFVQNFKAMRDADRQRNLGIFQSDIQNLMLGIPVDMKKTARAAKRAGLNIDFEGTAATPGTPAIPAQSMNVQAPPQTQQLPPLPDGSGAMPSVMNQPPPAPMDIPGVSGWPSSPYQPAQPQSLGQRIMNGLGWRTPAFNPNSPGAAALGQLGDEGQQRQALQQLLLGGQASLLPGQIQLDRLKQVADAQGIGFEGAKTLMLQRALLGDERARQMLVDTGMLPKIGLDEIRQAGQQIGLPDSQIAKREMFVFTGGPEIQKALLETAAKPEFFNRFKGGPPAAMQYLFSGFGLSGAPGIPAPAGQIEQPGRTPEEDAQHAQKIIEFGKDHPGMPFDLANTAVDAMENGSPDLVRQLTPILNKYSSQEAYDNHFKTGNLQVEIERLNQEAKWKAAELDLNARRAISDRLGTELTDYMNAARSATDPISRNALEQKAALLNQKLNNLEIPLGNGQNMTLGAGELGTAYVPSPTFGQWASPMQNLFNIMGGHWAANLPKSYIIPNTGVYGGQASAANVRPGDPASIARVLDGVIQQPPGMNLGPDNLKTYKINAAREILQKGLDKKLIDSDTANKVLNSLQGVSPNDVEYFQKNFR